MRTEGEAISAYLTGLLSRYTPRNDGLYSILQGSVVLFTLFRTYPTLLSLRMTAVKYKEFLANLRYNLPNKKRRHPDSNRRWRFCRPLPYLLAMPPLINDKQGQFMNCPCKTNQQFQNELPGQKKRETGFEPATTTLARWSSTN